MSSRTPPRAAARTLAFALPPVVLAAMVFHPIVWNFFYADDFLHLFQLGNGDALRFLLFPHGGHLYLVRNAVFYAAGSAFGTAPTGYFWTVLVTHLANVALLFGVLRGFTGSARLACLGATLWGISPLHDEPLGWYSVYGHVLATTCVLTVLLDASRLLAADTPLSPRRAWAWIGALLVAANSFGTAIGVALVFPLVAWLLGVRGTGTRPMPFRLWALPLLVLVCYVGALAAYTARYGAADTSLSPRLALIAGAGPIAVMGLHLLGAGITGLLLPFDFTRRIYPGPLSTALSVGVVALFLAAWLGAGTPARRRLIAFLLIATASYVMVALGRAVFYLINEQSLAQAATALRYHYLGSAALTLLLVTLLVNLLAELPDPLVSHPRWKDALVLVGVAALGGILSVRSRFIDHHPTARRQVEAFLATMHARVAEVPVGETVYITNQPFPLSVAQVPAAEYPGWAALFVMFFPTDMVDGRPVRFVAQDDATLAATRAGGRIATLLVPRTAAP